MTNQTWALIQSLSKLVLKSGSILLLLSLTAGTAWAQQATSAGQTAPAQGEPPKVESPSRGPRPIIREIKYDDWHKFCFKTPGTGQVCRTTISGTFETGQSAVRADLIEREGQGGARLQLFLPVGLYLQAGVKVSVDQGAPYWVPYVRCLDNRCIAAGQADPKLIQEMEAGQKLQLEVVDSSVLTVGTSIGLRQFAAVRKGAPTRVFEQDIDEP
jgi:invasion protein IalB